MLCSAASFLLSLSSVQLRRRPGPRKSALLHLLNVRQVAVEHIGWLPVEGEIAGVAAPLVVRRLKPDLLRLALKPRHLVEKQMAEQVVEVFNHESESSGYG